MREIKVTVQRFSAGKGTFEQSYTVPVDGRQAVSVMNLLEYIYEHLDSTLVFFSHAACLQAACGKCLVKMDGKNVLACKTLVDQEHIHLAPCGTAVRDLVCR